MTPPAPPPPPAVPDAQAAPDPLPAAPGSGEPDPSAPHASYRVLLYYRYFPVADPEAYAEAQRELCEQLDLRGRILVGKEGLNGTVSGTAENTAAYAEAMLRAPGTAGMPFKTDPADGHVFSKLSVKVRPEIVTLGLAPDQDVDPAECTGERLSPEAFHRAMQEENALLLDGRNGYESALGHFKGALCPEIENFREFPEWLDRHQEELRDRKILTYCTGGIRCEKLSGFLKKKGFDQVFQLEGGIVAYGQDPVVRGRDFDGLCYVFDERIGVEVNRTGTRRIISRCRRCGTEESRYQNCLRASCNARIFLCPACETEHGRYCSDQCREGATD